MLYEEIIYSSYNFNYLSSFLCSENIHFSSFWFVSLLHSSYSNHLKKFILHFKIFLACIPNISDMPVSMHMHVHTQTHTEVHTPLITAMLGVSLPSSGSKWDLPVWILNLPPAKCFFLSQKCSSKYFIKQLERSLRVVFACPKASKMHMTYSKREPFIELLGFFF